MSDPVGTFNDGGIKFVRQVVTAKDTSGASTQYVVKKGSMKRGVKRTTSTNENDVEDKQNLADTIPAGSITCQFILPTDLPMASKQYISLVTPAGTVAVLVGEVSDEFGAGDEAMFTAEVYQKQAP